MNKQIAKNNTIIKGDLIISKDENVKYPKLKEVIGNIYLRENAKLDAPLLATSGYIYLRENAKLVTKKTKKLNYKSVDNTMFVIESEKSTKGIKILTGYVLKGFIEGLLIKEVCFVAEKDNFFAHGASVKKSIEDLQFKIVSEKLKTEPITEDTMISINYFRLITGACEFGTKEWLQQNNIKVDSMKASELLPILEKTNAYGLDKFKKLITF